MVELSIQYNSELLGHHLVLEAIRVVVSPSKAIKIKETRKLLACAMNPMTGGPIKNPRYPMVETAASATPADTFFDFPAALYTNGTTDETPAPTRIKPAIEVAISGKTIAIDNPAAMIIPLVCNTLFIPKRVTSQSATNLPAAIVDINAVYPAPIHTGFAFTTF